LNKLIFNIYNIPHKNIRYLIDKHLFYNDLIANKSKLARLSLYPCQAATSRGYLNNRRYNMKKLASILMILGLISVAGFATAGQVGTEGDPVFERIYGD